MTRYLVAQKYAARDKVFAMGGSAGGLLMGAIANMAPQDYRGIVAQVPFVDVVTTMLDETIPLTTNEFDEWGNPKEKRYYDYMLSYSPYDNVAAQAYPAMFVGPGLWDSQVQYYEPAKWVARLRSPRPITIRCSSASTWRPATAASPGASSATARSPSSTRSSSIWRRRRKRSRGGQCRAGTQMYIACRQPLLREGSRFKEKILDGILDGRL